MVSIRDFIAGVLGVKDNDPFQSKDVLAIDFLAAEKRNGVEKGFIPQYYYKPPFGFPRGQNLILVRRLAQTTFVRMVHDAIISEVCSINGRPVPKDKTRDPEIDKELRQRIDHIKAFFQNPNEDDESWNSIRRKYIRDVLEVDSGVLEKVFNNLGVMVGIKARDGASFTKNPDPHGSISNRKDYLPDKSPLPLQTSPYELVRNADLDMNQAREDAAYFQYGFLTAQRPIPFGRKEIIWLELHPRTDDVYGRSPMLDLLKVVQLLVYSVDHELEYYTSNNVPKGVLWSEGPDRDTLKGFKDQWQEFMRQKDEFGQWRSRFHEIPLLNHKVDFTRLQFSAQELDFIAQQEWFSGLVWGCYGVSKLEMGLQQDAGNVTNVVREKKFRKRVINPILEMEKEAYEKQIISEFGYDDIEWEWETRDLSEESEKADLYLKQLQAGLVTVNEVRVQEGKPTVSWGDEPPASVLKGQNETSIRFEDGRTQSEGRRMESREPEESEERARARGKAKDDGIPAGAEGFEREIKRMLNELERQALEIIEGEIRPDVLSQVKDIRSLVDRVKALFTAYRIKTMVERVIKQAFIQAHERAEKEMDLNVIPNQAALQYLQEHTFENIKNMTEEVGNRLRAELERGIINAEGIHQLKERVRKVFEVTDSRAEAIARTEYNRAQNQGNLQAWKAAGVKDAMKYLIVTLDDRTSNICLEEHSKYGSREEGIPLSEPFEVTVDGKTYREQSPPFHPNCRTRVFTFIPEP